MKNKFHHNVRHNEQCEKVKNIKNHHNWIKIDVAMQEKNH